MINHRAVSNFRKFVSESHEAFSRFEGVGKSRTISLKETYEELSDLSAVQDDLIRQALRCVEQELYRAAHVMAWAAIADFLEDYCEKDGFKSLNLARPKWMVKSKEDLKDRFGEYAIIEAMGSAKLITKNQMKAFHGMLTKRNECAHPSDYYPTLNETLGYVSELITRIKVVNAKLSNLNAEI